MPNCRECGSRLSKLDKDICPVCGAKNPLQTAISQDTIEFTQTLDTLGKDYVLYAQKSKKKVALLAFVLGFLGLPFFYLNKTKSGIIWLISSLLIIGGLGSAISIPTSLYYLYAVMAGIVVIMDIVLGLYYLLKEDTKDGNGEFLK